MSSNSESGTPRAGARGVPSRRQRLIPPGGRWPWLRPVGFLDRSRWTSPDCAGGGVSLKISDRVPLAGDGLVGALVRCEKGGEVTVTSPFFRWVLRRVLAFRQ